MKYNLVSFYICLLSLLLSGCNNNSNRDNNSTPPLESNNIIEQNSLNLQDIPSNSNLEENEDNNQSNTNTINTNDKTICSSKYPKDILDGRALYIEHCKICHASDGKSGLYNILGATKTEISDAMGFVLDMSILKLYNKIDEIGVELIVLYLRHLEEDSDVQYATQCTDELYKLKKEQLGEKLFFDSNLSLTRNLSCSSCHNPGKGFIDARFREENSTNPVDGAFSVGDDGISLGGRNAPTVMYAQFIPTFEKNGNGEYFGGFFHDGRAATLKEQAKGPFLDKTEMMMPNANSVVSRVLENPIYVDNLKEIYGENIFDDINDTYDAIAESIAQFERTEVFIPFNSKYDRSKLDSNNTNFYEMTTLEKKGYELFFDKNQTNCSLCHAISLSGERKNQELFTNFKYRNTGTPRNIQAIQVRDGNTDKIDFGLGGRKDINNSNHYGKVRVPTLRNIEITGPYMSNGVFKNLRTVLEFYDHMIGQGGHPINPETNQTWDIPEINSTIAHNELNASQALSDDKIEALEAFLNTLTDY